MEVFASNIPAEEWASVLERCHDDSLENTDHTLLNKNEEETRSEICPQSEPQKTVTENLHLDIHVHLTFSKQPKTAIKKKSGTASQQLNFLNTFHRLRSSFFLC